MNQKPENDTTSRAERLFLAIGEVDERLLVSFTQEQPEAAREQSQTARKQPRDGKHRTLAARLRPVTRIAAVAVLCIAVVLSSARLLGLLRNPDVSQSPTANGQTLEALLLENLPAMTEVRNEEALYFFSGSPMLICRFSETGAYYVSPLSGQFRMLDGSKGGTALSPEESQAQDLRIWVCDGQGNVRSPQLSYSSGNASFGCLIDYLPELEPSDEVLNYLALQFA